MSEDLSNFRPRLTMRLTRDLRAAAALAGLTVPEYLSQVVSPMVATDLQARIERQQLQRMAGAD
ncbi:MAG: hypothetical protein CMI60_07360 [Parvibaculum sp.]|jgi:hypothetical protein|nr:hypothetical protein [Parvibaculum sp.]|tara:strand:+ start:306 stop:497 length:192 start_codon:yes stop_codon:yes gene_type:complete